MLRITIELLPHGDESQARHMGTAVIANDGTGTAEVGNYDVSLSTFDSPDKIWKRARVKGFRRKQLGPWDLLLLALVVAVGKRNKEAIWSILR